MDETLSVCVYVCVCVCAPRLHVTVTVCIRENIRACMWVKTQSCAHANMCTITESREGSKPEQEVSLPKAEKGQQVSRKGTDAQQ